MFFLSYDGLKLRVDNIKKKMNDDDEWSSYARIETLILFYSQEIDLILIWVMRYWMLIFTRNKIIISKSWNIENFWDVNFDK